MAYWPSPLAEIVIYCSARKRVHEADLWEYLALHPLQLQRLRYGHRDQRDMLYRSRRAIARAVLADGGVPWKWDSGSMGEWTMNGA